MSGRISRWLALAASRLRDETGASLVVAVGVVLVAVALSAGIVMHLQRSWQAVVYEQRRTQALYNARMGIDAAVALINKDLTTNAFTSSRYTQFQSQVNDDLQALMQPPFQAQVAVSAPQTDSQGNKTLTILLTSTGTAQPGVFGEASTVELRMQATAMLPASGGSGGGGSGGSTTPSAVTISDVAVGGVANVSVSGTGSTPVSLSGGSGGTVIVNGTSSAQVYGFPNLVQVTDNNSHPINGTLWLSGDGAVQSGPVNGIAVVTGNNAKVSGPVGGAAIVTGSNVSLFGPVNGPVLLMGTGDSVSGPVQCALVTADNVVIAGPVNGNLIVTGNNCTIQGPVAGEVIVTGSHLTIAGNVNGNGTYAMIALGSNEIVQGIINGNVIMLGNNVSAQHINGTVTQYSGQAITADDRCLGKVTLQFSSGQLQIQFSSATISG
ncbi:MAG: hypothetical protein IRZ33_04525 [Alicyclobacillaceae bacterium]|nr:hypothetical protein [Alicyclobacillaceae bacterium]